MNTFISLCISRTFEVRVDTAVGNELRNMKTTICVENTHHIQVLYRRGSFQSPTFFGAQTSLTTVTQDYDIRFSGGPILTPKWHSMVGVTWKDASNHGQWWKASHQQRLTGAGIGCTSREGWRIFIQQKYPIIVNISISECVIAGASNNIFRKKKFERF